MLRPESSIRLNAVVRGSDRRLPTPVHCRATNTISVQLATAAV